MKFKYSLKALLLLVFLFAFLLLVGQRFFVYLTVPSGLYGRLAMAGDSATFPYTQGVFFFDQSGPKIVILRRVTSEEFKRISFYYPLGVDVEYGLSGGCYPVIEGRSISPPSPGKAIVYYAVDDLPYERLLIDQKLAVSSDADTIWDSVVHAAK